MPSEEVPPSAHAGGACMSVGSLVGGRGDSEVWEQLRKGLETEDRELGPHMEGSEVTRLQILEVFKVSPCV